MTQLPLPDEMLAPMRAADAEVKAAVDADMMRLVLSSTRQLAEIGGPLFGAGQSSLFED